MQRSNESHVSTRTPGRLRLAVATVFLAITVMVALPTLQQRRAVDEMRDAADDFLGSLSGFEQRRATYPFDSDERSRHHFIPPEAFERNGIVNCLSNPKRQLCRFPRGRCCSCWKKYQRLGPRR